MSDLKSVEVVGIKDLSEMINKNLETNLNRDKNATVLELEKIIDLGIEDLKMIDLKVLSEEQIVEIDELKEYYNELENEIEDTIKIVSTEDLINNTKQFRLKDINSIDDLPKIECYRQFSNLNSLKYTTDINDKSYLMNKDAFEKYITDMIVLYKAQNIEDIEFTYIIPKNEDKII